MSPPSGFTLAPIAAWRLAADVADAKLAALAAGADLARKAVR